MSSWEAWRLSVGFVAGFVAGLVTSAAPPEALAAPAGTAAALESPAVSPAAALSTVLAAPEALTAPASAAAPSASPAAPATFSVPSRVLSGAPPYRSHMAMPTDSAPVTRAMTKYSQALVVRPSSAFLKAPMCG